MPSGLPAGLPQQVIDPTTGVLFPSTRLVPCSVLLGVTALILNFHSLAHTLDGLDLSPLSSSLTILDLTGMAAAAAAVQPLQAVQEALTPKPVACRQQASREPDKPAAFGQPHIFGRQCKRLWVPAWAAVYHVPVLGPASLTCAGAMQSRVPWTLGYLH